MRNFGHSRRNSSSPAPGVRVHEMARSATVSDLAVVTSFVRQFENSGAPATTHSVGKMRARPDAPPRGIAAAMSWLLGVVVDFFAACAAAMNPDSADLREYSDHHKLERNSRHHGPSEDAHRNGVVPLYADRPWIIENVVPTANAQATARWNARIASAVLGLWSAMRREREVKLAIMQLRTLNDHTLRDIGVPRCQIENAVRHGDHCGW